MSCFDDVPDANVVVGDDNRIMDHHHHLNVQMNGSYESSIDIFTGDDHHHIHPDSISVHHDDPHQAYIAKNNNHDANHHHDHDHDLHSTYLMDEEEDFHDHHDHHHHEIKPLSNEIELIFKQISHSISTTTTTTNKSGSGKQKQILEDIDGFASAGQVLAVMGPSGSGKTTLLNILSGRTKPTSGEITLNGQKMNKQLRRKICYVLQQDIFFPNLTLKQTLMYTARLRLPDSMKDSEKCASVEKIIEELQLTNCQHTIIGDISKRGLSGGEKKRTNIACELLTNPSVMLIDEPTSGLDSCTAHNLIHFIKNFASKRKKTVVMSIHQPSSQMFYLLDNLLLLSNGRLAYFGNVSGVVPFFGSIGYHITLHYNPAEFILEKIKDPQCEKKAIEAAKKLHKTPKDVHSTSESDQSKHHCTDHHHHHHHHHHHPHHPQQQQQHTNNKDDSWKKESFKSLDLHINEENHHHHQVYPKFHADNDSGRSSWSEPDRSSVFSSCSYFKEDSVNRKNNNKINKERKWPTSFCTQIQVLTERNFIEAKHRMLSKLNWIQTIVLGIVAGLIWFQVERKEETINDIRGWMFFTTTYWMLFGLFQALVSFPAEREVINKERSSGAYRLSSYYIAKMIGELPLTIALPTVFFSISYPMLGMNSILTFIYLWFFLIISTVCAQSFGLFIGATCHDLEVSVTISALYSLSTMLFAGYYTSMPTWLSWVRYLSIVYYSFQNMQMIEFGSANILCAEHGSKYPEHCQMNQTTTTTTTNDFRSPLYIPYDQLESNLDLMSQNTKPFPIWFNTLMLIIFLFIFRSFGYLVLRFARKSSN